MERGHKYMIRWKCLHTKPLLSVARWCVFEVVRYTQSWHPCRLTSTVLSLFRALNNTNSYMFFNVYRPYQWINQITHDKHSLCVVPAHIILLIFMKMLSFLIQTYCSRKFIFHIILFNKLFKEEMFPNLDISLFSI